MKCDPAKKFSLACDSLAVLGVGEAVLGVGALTLLMFE